MRVNSIITLIFNQTWVMEINRLPQFLNWCGKQPMCVYSRAPAATPNPIRCVMALQAWISYTYWTTKLTSLASIFCWTPMEISCGYTNYMAVYKGLAFALFYFPSLWIVDVFVLDFLHALSQNVIRHQLHSPISAVRPSIERARPPKMNDNNLRKR